MNRTVRRILFSLALTLTAASFSVPPPAHAAALPDPDSSRSERYRAGQRALADERWSDALQIFSAIADQKGSEADAALYWKAWTESKLGRRADALTTLATLQRTDPKAPGSTTREPSRSTCGDHARPPRPPPIPPRAWPRAAPAPRAPRPRIRTSSSTPSTA